MRRPMLRLLGAVAVVVGSVSTALTAHADEALSRNLLFDPSFEEGMYHQSMSNFIANGWAYFYAGRASDDLRGWYHPEPEFGIIADRPGQAHEGHKSQRWFNTWAVHDAGVYQRVKVPANSWLRFTIWMFNWSSQLDTFGVSESFHRKWVGIDPTGGTDAFAPTVIWGNEDRTMDVWVHLGVIAQAQGDAVTVFVRETPDLPVKHNDVLIDDASLVVIPPPAQPVVQPVAVGEKKATNNDTPQNAVMIGRVATSGALAGDVGGKYAFFKFELPEGASNYKVNVLASPDDSASLGKFGFRVYGPTTNKVYAVSGGLQKGMTPNISADLPPTAEPGTYVVQLYNANPTTTVRYRIWLTGKNLVGEVAEATPTPAAEPVAAPVPAAPAVPAAPGVVPLGPAVAPPVAPITAPATQPSPTAAPDTSNPVDVEAAAAPEALPSP